MIYQQQQQHHQQEQLSGSTTNWEGAGPLNFLNLHITARSSTLSTPTPTPLTRKISTWDARWGYPPILFERPVDRVFTAMLTTMLMAGDRPGLIHLPWHGTVLRAHARAARPHPTRHARVEPWISTSDSKSADMSPTLFPRRFP
jgi:hypothetical protein